MRVRTLSRHHLIGFSLAALFSLGHPLAIAWNDQVTQACTHEGHAATEAEIAICHAYIEGFLDGAVITDTAVIASVEEGAPKESDYLKRAYMTRMGSYNPKLPATALAHFCLPQGMEREEVVEAIATAIALDESAAEDVSISLYNILQAHYPCEES